MDAAAISEAVKAWSAPPSVEVAILGTTTWSACTHPLSVATTEGELQGLAFAVPDDAIDRLASHLGSGLWLLHRPDLLAGPLGPQRSAQWIAPASATEPDLASVPGIAIVGRSAPGRHALTIAISGSDRAALRTVADALRADLKARGQDVLDEPPARAMPSHQLTPAGRRAGIHLSDLPGIASSVAVSTTRDRRPIRLAPDDADRPRADLPIVLPTGGTAPLSTLVETRVRPAPDLARLDAAPVHLVHVVTSDPSAARETIDAVLKDRPPTPGTFTQLLP